MACQIWQVGRCSRFRSRAPRALARGARARRRVSSVLLSRRRHCSRHAIATGGAYPSILTPPPTSQHVSCDARSYDDRAHLRHPRRPTPREQLVWRRYQIFSGMLFHSCTRRAVPCGHYLASCNSLGRTRSRAFGSSSALFCRACCTRCIAGIASDMKRSRSKTSRYSPAGTRVTRTR